MKRRHSRKLARQSLVVSYVRESIVKIGTWDDLLGNIAEIEHGRELRDKKHADWHLRLWACKRRKHPLLLEDMDFV